MDKHGAIVAVVVSGASMNGIGCDTAVNRMSMITVSVSASASVVMAEGVMTWHGNNWRMTITGVAMAGMGIGGRDTDTMGCIVTFNSVAVSNASLSLCLVQPMVSYYLASIIVTDMAMASVAM